MGDPRLRIVHRSNNIGEAGTMPTGMLEVNRTIDLTRFWRTGANAFRFTPRPASPSDVTHAFDGTQVYGNVAKGAIDQQQRIIIRLQAVDAPELHHRPTAPTLDKKKPTSTQHTAFNTASRNLRQFFSQTSTVRLFTLLSKVGKSAINYVIRTLVDQPNYLFDTFGRFIADTFVKVGGKEQDANQWFCLNGWAFPTFHSLVTNNEIATFTQHRQKTQAMNAGIWKKASGDLAPFDAQDLSQGRPAWHQP
jgi:endonuclease YncB( thermonuclease family)